MYLAIVIRSEIKIDRIISVLDIESIDVISVMLVRVEKFGARSIFMIRITLNGIYRCQYILDFINTDIDNSIRSVSSIY